MIYLQNADLPGHVLRRLPEPAHELYRKAFNNAWSHYRNGDTPPSAEVLEDMAHLVAWASIEENYHKTPRGRWVPD